MSCSSKEIRHLVDHRRSKHSRKSRFYEGYGDAWNNSLAPHLPHLLRGQHGAHRLDGIELLERVGALGDGGRGCDGRQREGCEARGLTLTYDALQSAVQSLPALVYVEIGRLRHCVVVRGASSDKVGVADASVGNSIYSTEEFLAMWKGQTALFVAKDVATIDQAFLAAPPGVQPSLTEMRRSMILGGN